MKNNSKQNKPATLPTFIALRVTSGIRSGVITRELRPIMIHAAIGRGEYVELATEYAAEIFLGYNDEK